jgi:hypothetical protein
VRYGVQAILPQYAGGQLRWIPHRNGRRVTALVYHRMLGHLKGTDEWFRDYRSGTTSTHFGIGFMSSFDRLIGRAQTRQWADTDWTAYGWSWRPNDTPTQIARDALGADLYNPSADLNWQVIHCEVEGLTFSEPWHPAFVTQAKGLEKAVYTAHGPVVRLWHGDCSPKNCPGFWPADMGPHGGKLLTSLPKPPAPEDPMEWVQTKMTVQVPKRMYIPRGVDVFPAPGKPRYGESPGRTVWLVGELREEGLWAFLSENNGLGLVRKSEAGKIG